MHRSNRNNPLPRIFLAGVILSGIPAVATPPAAIKATGGEGYMERARRMLSHKNYIGAVDQLHRFIAETSDRSAEVGYMLARACYGLDDAETLVVLDEFLASWPASADALQARVLKADCLFFRGSYALAAREYENCGYNGMSPAERDRCLYRLAVCRVKTGEFKAAARDFASLRPKQAYSLPSLYYLSYIDYALGRLPEALEGFTEVRHRMLSSDEVIADGVFPEAYIAQILFAQGDYNGALEAAESQLRHPADSGFVPEMQRIAGESCFKLGRMDSADDYLRSYLSHENMDFSPSAIYDMGVLEYDAGHYDSAAQLFSRITDHADAISQGAYLYLGQCAVRNGDDTEAAIEFEKAYRMGFDPKVTETALYNYASALTRGGRIPFGSSGEMMERFLTTFPDSRYRGNVREYLATAYYNEGDYSRALKNIEAIDNPGGKVLSLKQKTLYELGVHAAADNRWEEAAAYMERAAALSSRDASLAANATLWRAEALYNLGRFAASQKCYQNYLESARGGKDRALGVYGLGYSLYMQDKFAQALPYFSKAKNDASLSAEMRDDALVREADCTYYAGDYSGAARLFAQAASSDTADKAYALMRKAMMEGLKGDTSAKIKDLEEMSRRYPTSSWIPQAMCELASTYAEKGDIKASERTLRSVLTAHPDAPEARKASLLLGAIFASHSMPDKAITAYENLIRRWPASDEAVTANNDLRRLYADRGELDKYLSFISGVPGAPQPDRIEIERLAFEAAEETWLNDTRNTSRLEQFLRQYPDGKYAAAVLLDLAISAEEAGDMNKALERLETLLASGNNSPQAPEAMAMRARILEENFPDRKADILNSYRMLEKFGGSAYAPQAAAGLARLSSNPSEKLAYAEKALAARDIDSEARDALLYEKAMALNALGRQSEAMAILEALAANTATLTGAKATVAIGDILIASGNTKRAIELLTRFTDEGTPHQYWLARGYISLADAYTKAGKKSTAREYLRSLRENYPGNEPDIRNMIDTRLKK